MKSCISCGSRIFRAHEFCPICGGYQTKNKFKDISKRELKKKRYAGLAIVGIIFIILGAISFIFLSEYPNLCGSIIGQFAQIVNQQVQQVCFVIQTWKDLIGIILVTLGVILLAVRAEKRRH